MSNVRKNSSMQEKGSESLPAQPRRRSYFHPLHLPARLLSLYMGYKIKSQFQLDKPDTLRLPAPQPGHKYVLYIHVPFCERLCPYCTFNRFIFIEAKARNYFKRLHEELQMLADLGYRFESAYIGGGTPTILIDELTRTIDLAKQLFGIREVSCETNPNHLTEEIISSLEGRVDRLSVGIQSFDDDLLWQINRYEKYGSGEEIFKRIQTFNDRLPTLNADLIFNFPTQTEEILSRDIQRVIESGVSQCTFYPLMGSTSLKDSMKALGDVNYYREAQLYDLINENLTQAYQPVSAWTYSRKGKVMLDEYIVQYEEYVGAGSGSFSYLNGQLFVNTFSLTEYDQIIRAKRLPLAATRKFGKLEQMQYRFMMSLFDHKLDKKKFLDDFGTPVEAGLWKEMAFMGLMGAIDHNGDKILELLPERRYLMVVMMREFFTGVNTVREQARRSLSPQEQLMCLSDDGKIV